MFNIKQNKISNPYCAAAMKVASDVQIASSFNMLDSGVLFNISELGTGRVLKTNSIGMVVYCVSMSAKFKI